MANDGDVDQSEALLERLRSEIDAATAISRELRQLEQRAKARTATIAAPQCSEPERLTVNATRPVLREAYEGERKDGKRHGRGICRYGNDKVYDGEWRDDVWHGSGTFTSNCSYVNEGQWVEGRKIYEGEFKDGEPHGWGTVTWPFRNSYDGEFVEGKQHGEGTFKWADGRVYEGEFVSGKMHGRGVLMYASGNLYQGQWVEGKRHGKGHMECPKSGFCEQAWTNGQLSSEGRDAWKKWDENEGGLAPDKTGDVLSTNQEKEKRAYNHECMARSQRSQQRRLEKNMATKKCEHCGAGDDHYKLRVCSRCNLALYCSLTCQEAASSSHRRICDMVPDLPPRDADSLVLKYDKNTMVDLDAGLRYATKYMDSLKHLEIDLLSMRKDGALKLSAKKLSSAFKSKKGTLESLSWISGFCSDGYDPSIHSVWKELHDLKQLRFQCLQIDNVQRLYDVIGQQKNTLLVLSIQELDIDWANKNCRTTLGLAVSFCRNLVKLDLAECVPSDSDLEIILFDLPNLRSLNLERHCNFSGFTDKSCELIARKCPNLQQVNLNWHHYISVSGIRKIFEGCPHLRSFHTTATLSCEDVGHLLDAAPQLLHISLDEHEGTDEPYTALVEATGGRTLIQFIDHDGCILLPKGLSAKARKRFKRQQAVYNKITSKNDDPGVVNEWEDLWLAPDDA